MSIYLFGLVSLFFSPVAALASEIVFEGYFKISHESKHIGFSVQRVTFDSKAKVFENIQFVKFKLGDTEVSQSLKARANERFQPISYSYTGLEGKTIKTIDATFKGDVMKLKIIDGKKVRDETHKIPEKSFLSSFLLYMLIQKPLKPDEAFKYSGVAEEAGASSWGRAMIASREDVDGRVMFRLLNSFEKQDWEIKLLAIPETNSPVANKFERVEPLSSENSAQNLRLELVASATEATDKQSIPTKTLLSLFGTLPSGKVNLLAKPSP